MSSVDQDIGSSQKEPWSRLVQGVLKKLYTILVEGCFLALCARGVLPVVRMLCLQPGKGIAARLVVTVTSTSRLHGFSTMAHAWKTRPRVNWREFSKHKVLRLAQ